MLRILLSVIAFATATSWVSVRGQDAEKPLSKIAFGSCANQDKPLPIYDSIVAQKPELLLLLGDNMYADLERGVKVTPAVMKQKYDILAKIPGWQKLKATCPMLAVWDDHDYGKNDAGVEWELKDESKKLMLDFFEVPADSPRRKRDGVYVSAIYGPPGKRVQVIMLDNRYFRTKLTREERPLPGTRIVPYLPAKGPDATLLGVEQWKWLEDQLKQPAEVRLLCSGIQVVSEEHPFEKWTNFPEEREKLYRIIRNTKANGVIVLSGDRHMAELSLDSGAAIGYPLYDATSSGLNQADKNWRAPEANKNRIGGMPFGDNFGMVTINWNAPDPLISLQLRDVDGEIAVRHAFSLSLLKPTGAAANAVALPEGVLGAREALKKVGQAVTVQFAVEGGSVVSGGKRILLNSEKNFRSETNFTVVINAAAMTGKLEKANVETFKGKTIRVKGTVTEFKGSPQIQVDDEKTVEILEK